VAGERTQLLLTRTVPETFIVVSIPLLRSCDLARLFSPAIPFPSLLIFLLLECSCIMQVASPNWDLANADFSNVEGLQLQLALPSVV
jgi:hypothetical protein